MNAKQCSFFARPLTLGVAAALATVAPLAAAESGLMLEEVVVTAQKRDQSIQDVPSAVSVLGGDMLKDFQAQDFTDLELLAPGLVTDNLDARSGSISLRGISYNPNSAAAQAVDVYWNDTPVSALGGGVFQQIFDLQRVELLKGPQGTLQGRSSPAGAIILHTTKPDMEEFEGTLAGQLADNDGINTSASVSLPLIPGELSTRVAAVYDESDLDEARNIGNGSTRSKEAAAGRFSLAWLPGDITSVDFAYQYLDTESVDFNTLQGTSLDDPTLPTLDAADRKGIQLNDAEGDATYRRASLHVNLDLSSHQLDILTGWSDVDSTVNAENLNSEGFRVPEESQRQILEDDYEFWSQELRFSNTDGDFVEYMFGLYYAEEDGEFTRFDFRIGGLPDRDRVIRTPFKTEYTAVFTHNIFHITEDLTAQFGLRWQNREQTIRSDLFAGEQGLFGDPEGTLFATLIPEEFQESDDDAVTGTVNLQYYLTDPDIMIYTSYSTGYRAGGVTVAPVDLGNLVNFAEEDSWSAEVGLKGNFLDGRLALNAAVFYQEFEDYIARVSRVAVTGSTNTVGITDNADAEATGIEADFNALISESWSVGGGISYVEAKFANGAELVCTNLVAGVPVIPNGETAATCDVDGQALGPEPEWSLSLNTEYTVPLNANEVYVRALYKYTGEREDTDIDDLDAYQTVDLFVGLREASGEWDVGLFARNLFDEDEIIRASSPGLHRRQPTGYQAVDVVGPRTIGLSASYNF